MGLRDDQRQGGFLLFGAKEMFLILFLLFLMFDSESTVANSPLTWFSSFIILVWALRG